MERGRKDGLSACSTASLWTTDVRSARDVHDLDRSKVILAASGARKECQAPFRVGIISLRPHPATAPATCHRSL
jgi:hypothetical protein